MYSVLLFFLLAIQYCLCSIASSDSRLITIRKTIHKNESLIYNVTEMFPGLIENPFIEHYTPGNSTVEERLGNSSNFNLSNPINFIYNQTIQNLSSCSDWFSIDHESFIGICSDRTEAIHFEQNPTDKVITYSTTYLAPPEQKIRAIATDHENGYLYYLCQADDDLRNFSVYAAPTDQIPDEYLNISFRIEIENLGSVKIKIDKRSAETLRRILVIPVMDPNFYLQDVFSPVYFVSALHAKTNSSMHIEGIFTTQADPKGTLNRKVIFDDYKGKKFSNASYLEILPFEFGLWMLSVVSEETIDGYVLRSCQIEESTVERVNLTECICTCNLTYFDCPEALNETENVQCKVDFPSYLPSADDKNSTELLIPDISISPEDCNLHKECTDLKADCSCNLNQCKDTSVTENLEPVFVCSDEAPVGSMCANFDIDMEQYKQYYRIGAYAVDNTSSFYMITNCMFAKFSFQGATLYWNNDTGYFRLAKSFKSAKAIGKTETDVFTFLRPFDDNTTYLTIYNLITHTARVFQSNDQAFYDDDYVLLMDLFELQRDYIVSYDFDESNNQSVLSVYNYSDQTFSTRLKENLTFIEESTLLTTRLIGQCDKGQTLIYQFEITVLNSVNKLYKPAGVVSYYWYYQNSSKHDEWFERRLPIDLAGFSANDPRFSLNSSGVQVEDNNVARFKNRAIFRRGNSTFKSLPNYAEIKDVTPKGRFMLIVYSNMTVSIMDCGHLRKLSNKDDIRDETFNCRFVLEFFELPGGADEILNYLVIYHEARDNYHILVMYHDVMNDIKIAVVFTGDRSVYIHSLNAEDAESIVIETVFMFYSNKGNATVIAICSNEDSERDGVQRLVNQSYYRAFIPIKSNPTVGNLTINLTFIQKMDLEGRVILTANPEEDSYTILQEVDEGTTVITWMTVKYPGDERIQIIIDDAAVIDTSRFAVKRVIGPRLILFDRVSQRVVFRSNLQDKIKQLDTNVRPIYEGVLPVPGLDTNGDSIKDLVDIDVIQGIFIMGLNRSETDTANITKQFIDIYVVDMRGNDDDPIGRLRLKMTVEVPPYNGPLLVLQYLDPVTLRIHALICFEQGNIHVVGELHGSKATLKILPSKLGNGITERNMRYSGSACNESDSLLVPLKIVAAEWDDVIVAHATSNPYDLENNETSILEIESHLINIASHRAGYDVIAPESFKGTFEVIPMIVPDKRVSSLILPQPFQFKAEDKIFVHDDAHLLIRGKNSVTIFKIDSGRPPILLFNKTYSQNVLTAYMTYDPKMNYKVRGSGPLEFVFVLLKGDYDKNDVDMNVYDSTNFTSTAYYTDKDVGYCDCIRFEVIKRNQEIFSFSVHCRTKRGSGTTWTLSMVDLIPTNTDDKSITGTILGGFKPGDPYNGKPFQMKYKPLDGSGYGMMRPTSSSTLSYYFFDNMGQVGLMYFGNNKEVFGYHTFSTTCVLRQDTSISCRIFEQDMDLGCIVLCDQVRIESFKVRIRVDELDTENNEALTGVKVIKEEGYKIPINHKVLHLQKGETFDFVVTETSDKNQSVLMYDTATGLILYRMNASEICPKENPGCKLDSLYIHQFGDNRILLLPEGGQLDNSMFIWQKPQLNFSRDQLRKSGSLKEFKLVINSVTTKETNKMISILDLFKPKQEDFFWVYLAFVIVLAIFLVLCFLLLLYMNWRAEERAQVRKEDKEREKNSGLDRVNRMSKQDYKEVPSEKENNRTSLLPQPSVAADTNRTSLYKKKTIKL